MLEKEREREVHSILINILTISPALTRYVLALPSGRGLQGRVRDPLAFEFEPVSRKCCGLHFRRIKLRILRKDQVHVSDQVPRRNIKFLTLTYENYLQTIFLHQLYKIKYHIHSYVHKVLFLVFSPTLNTLKLIKNFNLNQPNLL